MYTFLKSDNLSLWAQGGEVSYTENIEEPVVLVTNPNLCSEQEETSSWLLLDMCV